MSLPRSEASQDELSERDVITEDASHEVIVDWTQAAQTGKIILAFTGFAFLFGFMRIENLDHLYHLFDAILHGIYEEFKNRII